MLRLRLENPSSGAICIAQADTERIEFYQSGERIWPEIFVSRALLMWRNANLISGMVVVPPKKDFLVYYDLTDWPLKRGPVRAAIKFPTYDCASFFESESPAPTELGSQFEFNARPSEQRHN